MVEAKTAFDEKQQQGSGDLPVACATPVEQVDDQQPSVLRSIRNGESSSNTHHSPNEKMVASGTTGAVLGFLFGGPILSALLGFGAAYVSKTNGAPGDAARALGDVGVSVKKTAIEVDEKHHIVEKSTKVASSAWDGAKQYDQKHNVLDTTKHFAVANWQSFVHFIHERRILQKGVDGFGRGYEFVAEKVGCGEKNTTDDTTTFTKTTEQK
jgi:hypothetical protein